MTAASEIQQDAPTPTSSAGTKTWQINLLLAGALCSQTQGYRALGPLGGLAVMVVLSVVVYVSARSRVPRRSGAMYLFAANFVFLCGAAVHSIFSEDRYITAMCLREGACALLVVTAACIIRTRPDAERALRQFASLMFWLLAANLLVAALVWTVGLPPLFKRELGQVQPRIYSHYIISASEDNFRFISFFDEPSDLVWLTTSAVLIQMYLRNKRRALFMTGAMAAALSGSLPIAYCVLLVAIGSYWAMPLLLTVGYFLQARLDDISAWALSTPGADRLAQRYFTQNGDVAVSRSGQFTQYLGALHFWPTAIQPDDIGSAGNGSYLLLLRYGILYAPLFLATIAMLVWYSFRGFTTNRLFGVFFLSQILMFLSRETPLNSPIIWIPWLAMIVLMPEWRLSLVKRSVTT